MNEPFAAREPSAELPAAIRAKPYEFTGPQEATISSLANLMHIVGAANIALGLLSLLSLMNARGIGGVVILGQAAAMLLMGSITWVVGSRFKRISDTIGSDIAYLMNALGGLRTLYLVQVWALGILLVCLALLILLLILR